MRIISRAEWGAAPARSTTPLRPERVNLFVLHHTTGSYRGAKSVQQIQAFHQGPERGWSDIAYNFLVAPDGAVYEGRGWGFTGAHARGKNSESVGVAFIGDGSKPMPDAAKVSVLELLQQAESRFGSLRIVGHRDVGTTACPGDAIYAWWSSDAPRAFLAPSGGVVAEKPEVSAEGISERPRAMPDIRQGWIRELERFRRLRRR
jgi:hypothetical protein